ncbi:hypothetical protein SELMODRAFT_17644, partial [Selaginella moellendorffii]
IVEVFATTINSKSFYLSTKEVFNNVTIERQFSPAEVLLQPKVSITNAGNRDLFMLVMVDPDPPGPQIPILRNILHWIVVNIPAQSTNASEQGDHLAPYLSPTPVQGVHRYYFLLFRQVRKTLSSP